MADDAVVDRPWMKRPEWARGEIHSHARAAAIVSAAVAVFWNVISWTCAIAGIHEILRQSGFAAIFVMIFPAIGIGLAVWTIRAFLRWRVYGDSRFIMASVPGQIGGSLTGTIRADHALSPLRAAHLELACIRRSTSGAGDNRSTTETVLWSDAANVSADASGAVPVAFYIPDDCRESDDSSRLDTIVWRLKASMPGNTVAYSATFEVPVFKIAQTPAQVADVLRIRQEHEHRVGEYQPSARSRIVVRLAPDGSTEAYFPPLRAPSAAFWLLVIFAIWTAVAALMIVVNAPLIFRIVWPLSDLALFAGMMTQFGGSTIVRARADALTISKRFFGIELSHLRVEAQSVEGLRAAPGFTAGATVYSRIRVDVKGASSRYFGDGIAEVNEAEWIALKLARALGLSAADGSGTEKKSA